MLTVRQIAKQYPAALPARFAGCSPAYIQTLPSGRMMLYRNGPGGGGACGCAFRVVDGRVFPDAR